MNKRMAFYVRSASGRWDRFCEIVQGFISKNVSEFEVEGGRIRGYRSPDTQPIWIRDHTHQLKAAKYFDSNLQSALDFFLKRQLPNGSFYERVSPQGRLGRVECEADVEYHFVRAVFLAWQATGDDEWMARCLGPLERGLKYCMTSPIRWSGEHRLIKRPFTIDTWDFQYLGPGAESYSSKIGPHSRFGIMHGDNSGLYEACRLLARMLERVGDGKRARHWLAESEGIRERLNALCWNGTFYKHVVHIDPVQVSGVNEDEILSLSNPYDINRGVATHKMAVSILDEYARRGREAAPRPFAEWFSIQPCFPGDHFGKFPHEFGERRYVNGALMPLVGGELARAAFEHGRERYGVRQLDKYAAMLRDTGKAYLCYHYDGAPDLYRDTITPRDGWGSAAFLYALIEGLAGVEDESVRFRDVRLSPRWVATEEPWAEVSIGYAASGARLGYRFDHDKNRREIRLALNGERSEKQSVKVHLLMPKNSAPARILGAKGNIAFSIALVEESVYADFTLQPTDTTVTIIYNHQE